MLRFTETKKWEDGWFRSLSDHGKLMYLYLVDVCDHAGVWAIDYDLASFMTRVPTESIGEAIAELGGRVSRLSGTEKLYLPKFVKFQVKGELKETHNPHKAIIRALSKHGLEYDAEAGIVRESGVAPKSIPVLEPDVLPFELETTEDQVVLAYHKLAYLGLPKVRVVTDKRKKQIAKFVKLLSKASVGLDEFFQKVADSTFLLGHANGWKANFDWLIQESNASKVIEGNYDGQSREPSRQDHTAGF